MSAVCEYCHEVAIVSAGYFVQHGYTLHGKFIICDGSFKPFCSICT